MANASALFLSYGWAKGLHGCRNMSLIAMNMTRGCPCTPQVMCGLKHGYYGIINEKACGAPRC